MKLLLLPGSVLVVAWLALSCRAEESLGLGVFEPVQLETGGLTAVLSPTDDSGLVQDGWQVRGEQETAEFVMDASWSRLVFFSPKGSTSAIEAILAANRAGAKLRRLQYFLNGELVDTFSLFPGHPGFRLDLPQGLVRRGRNVLDLAIENEDGTKSVEPLRVRSFRFLPHATEARPMPVQARLRVVGDDIVMPAATSFELALRVPSGSTRLEGRVQVSLQGEGDQALGVVVTLTDSSGRSHSLMEAALRHQRSAHLDVPLDAWARTLVAIRIDIHGPSGGAARWRRPRVIGAADVQPFPQLIQARPVERSASLGRPDVLLILIDAARADALSCYGGPGSTPAIDRLASEGTRFVRALSPTSWTAQSIPSILTGLFPEALGISAWSDSLSPSVPTLAEAFSKAGYRTVLWAQHPLYRHHKSLSRGFDEVMLPRRAMRDRLPTPADLFTAGKPTFAFIHLLPPHAPYNAPAPFAGMYSSWYEGSLELDQVELKLFPNKRDPDELSQADRQFIRDRYQEKVTYADSLVGQVIAAAKKSNRYTDALVAVVSDHGEAFLEHDRFLHTALVYTEFVHVPFVVKWPASTRGFQQEVTEPVMLVDLMPTLVDGVSLPVDGTGFQGRSLLPVVLGGQRLERAVYAMTRGVHRPSLPPKTKLRLEANGFSAVLDPLVGKIELYRLAEDPVEAVDLAQQLPALALLFKQSLLMQHRHNAQLFGQGLEQPRPLSQALEDELRALGYL